METNMCRNYRYLLAVMCALAGAVGWAQGRNVGFDWPATSADAQRTGWLRLDPNISVEGLSKPGFEFQWREKLNNTPRQTVSLSQGVTMNGLLGFSPASFISGASNNVFAIDNDTGYPLWHRRFDVPLPAPTPGCPGGMTAAAGRVVSLVPPALELPATAPPRSGYRGGIGLPGEGVPMEIARRDGGAALRGVAPIPVARGGGGGGVFAGRYTGPIYAVSSAGTLHSLGQTSGIDLQRPAPFLPANARYSDLTAVGDRLYTSTSEGCGGASNAVWAITLDADNKSVSSWKTNGGSPVGDLAFTTGGKLLVAIGPGTPSAGGYANAIVSLDAKTLQPTDWISTPTTEFVTTPVVLSYSGGELVVGATRDGRLLLLDAASLGGANHSTPLFSSIPLATSFAPDALATFEQAGARWLLVPVSSQLPPGMQPTNGAITNGAIVAFRIAQAADKLAFEPGWISRDLAAPTAPIVVNDVVFAAASGRPQGAAVLYAFDSRTGRELWNSGKTMSSYIPPGNLWASNSQVYVGTYDGTVYAFGFTLERR
jgi:outer membrane protein assembly factor BamB